MEKEKFSNIQSRLPDDIAYFSQNLEDTSLFFGPRNNPFFVDYSSKKKYLKQIIEKDIKLLSHFDEKIFDASKLGERYLFLKKKYAPDEVMHQFKLIKQLELDFCLYSAYALELMHGETLFQFAPPFDEENVKYILEHRQNNFDYYKKLFGFYSSEIKKNSLFIDENKSIKNIIKDDFGNAIIADARMLLDTKLQNKLAYNVKKYPVTEGYHHIDKNNYDFYLRYYIGEYKNKKVLFSEVIRVSKKQAKGKKQEYSYQLNVVLNGDVNQNRILYRIDCNADSRHLNKLEGSKGFNFASGSDVDVEALRKKDVKPCHIHTPNTKYAVIFPNYIHSCDAKDYDFKFKNYDKFVEFNRNLIKTEEDKFLIPNTLKNKIKESGNYKKVNLITFLTNLMKKGEQIDKTNQL